MTQQALRNGSATCQMRSSVGSAPAESSRRRAIAHLVEIGTRSWVASEIGAGPVEGRPTWGWASATGAAARRAGGRRNDSKLARHWGKRSSTSTASWVYAAAGQSGGLRRRSDAQWSLPAGRQARAGILESADEEPAASCCQDVELAAQGRPGAGWGQPSASLRRELEA